MTDPELLRVRGLSKLFGPQPRAALARLQADEDVGDHVIGVHEASFEVERGEIFVLMGLSGSGKSTLVRMLNRLIEPTAGQILLGGEDVMAMSRRRLIEMRRHRLSMVFQSFALLPHRRVIDNVAFGLEVSDGRRKAHRETAQAALELVGVGDAAKRWPHELSGGMQQRVGLARAWVTRSDVLLMDEAFSALDPLIRAEMQDALLDLQRRERRTIVFVSHDLGEAVRIADRIAIMSEGRIVQIGTPVEIVNNPANDYVRAFFQDVEPGRLFTAGDVAAADAVVVLPEDVPVDEARRRLGEAAQGSGVVVDGAGRLRGLVNLTSLEGARGTAADAVLEKPAPVLEGTPLEAIIAASAAADLPLPVQDENGTYIGAITQGNLLGALAKTRFR